MNPISITSQDHAKLSLLLRANPGAARNPSLRQLQAELDRAEIVDPLLVAPQVVTMDSHVEIEDVETGEIEDYTLVFPERANVDERKLSVLAPIGTALIGFREGDEVSWATPGGTRRLKIRRVVQPARATAAALS